ncbi:hypothetical protein FE783_05015 [Paenibacillus mesophilus]|uniref:hypothetical protein n=1 Tax=Paenibacillus mesophilus TaxID=2582849 RepID=UPI00110E9E92|nr:hypothetical protein [Paenibacillus mesophilus]TMV52303.1 hypothetical protein FE783_05015 [Paenibacillus mesophilus]
MKQGTKASHPSGFAKQAESKERRAPSLTAQSSNRRPPLLTANTVMHLQRTIGNRSVGQLIRSSPLPSQTPKTVPKVTDAPAGRSGLHIQAKWDIDEFSMKPGAYYVNYETMETYDPDSRQLGHLTDSKTTRLDRDMHWKKMRDIKQDLDIDFEDEYEEAIDEHIEDLELEEPWESKFVEAADKIADTMTLSEAQAALNKLVNYLGQMIQMVDSNDTLRPSTKEHVMRRIMNAMNAMADGRGSNFEPTDFMETFEQERLAQHLIELKKNAKMEQFKETLDRAKPVVEETKTGFKLAYYAGNIRLGEVTLVKIKQDTVELHFNVEEPLKYIGVASHLWNKGIVDLEKMVPQLKGLDVILPAFSSASTLMVTRQLANIGGNASDFMRGKKAGDKRKTGKDVVKSASEQHEKYKTGGKDESTEEELRHYMRSVAKSVYNHDYGIVGYVIPWRLVIAYGIDPLQIDGKTRERMEEAQAANTSTLSGHIEVRQCHDILKLKYDEGKFVTAVENGQIKMMLGISGKSLIDFSLKRKTLKTAQRWMELTYAEKTV